MYLFSIKLFYGKGDEYSFSRGIFDYYRLNFVAKKYLIVWGRC